MSARTLGVLDAPLRLVAQRDALLYAVKAVQKLALPRLVVVVQSDALHGCSKVLGVGSFTRLVRGNTRAAPLHRCTAAQRVFAQRAALAGAAARIARFARALQLYTLSFTVLRLMPVWPVSIDLLIRFFCGGGSLL